MTSSSVKGWLAERLPDRTRPAARYWYRAATARLDREIAVIGPLLRPSTVAVDVGAHDGVYSYFFARRGLVVHAFEPIPDCARRLARSLPAISVHEVALSNKRGTGRLTIPLVGGEVSTGRAALGADAHVRGVAFETAVARLDDYELEDVSIMKIDVEGHELEVLRGSSATISKSRPILLVELELRHLGDEGWSAAVDWITQQRYAGFFVHPFRGVQPLSDFRANELQRVRGGEPLEPYVNNFIFIPGERADLVDRAARMRPRGRLKAVIARRHAWV